MGRQFLDDGLVTNTVINHSYAIKKPFKAIFHVSLSGHEAITDLITAMRKVRPPLVGARVFPKWSLQGLLSYLNSDSFEPLETAPFDSQKQVAHSDLFEHWSQGLRSCGYRQFLLCARWN